MSTLRSLWPTLLLMGAPLLFLPYGFDVREVPRAGVVLVFAATAVWTARTRLPWWSLPWLGVCLLAAVWVAAPMNETLLGALPSSQGTLLWLGYALIVLSSAEPAHLRTWPLAASALTLVQASIAIVQAWQAKPICGTLGHPVFLGAWGALGTTVAMGLAIDYRGRQRAFAFAVAVAGLVCIALAGRRSPMIMLAVALVGMVVLLRPPARRVLPLGAALVSCMAVLALGRWLMHTGDAHDTVSGRVTSFSGLWHAITTRPWSGFGPSRFADLAATWTPAGFRYYEARPHNLALLVAFSLGVPALLAFVAFVIGASAAAWKNARAASADTCGRIAAAAALGPAYGCHLMVNVDQPGLGIWVCALWATAVTLRAPVRTSWRYVAALSLGVAGLLPIVGSLAIDVCQRLGDDNACRVADATGSTGCLALRVRSELARRRDAAGTATQRAAWMARCDPDDRLAHFHHALALADSGRTKDAIAEMEQVARALPGIEEVQMGFVELLVRDGQLTRALAELHPEQARPEMRGPMWRLRGMLFDEAHDAAAALIAYEAALRFMPADTWLPLRISELKK